MGGASFNPGPAARRRADVTRRDSCLSERLRGARNPRGPSFTRRAAVLRRRWGEAKGWADGLTPRGRGAGAGGVGRRCGRPGGRPSVLARPTFPGLIGTAATLVVQRQTLGMHGARPVIAGALSVAPRRPPILDMMKTRPRPWRIAPRVARPPAPIRGHRRGRGVARRAGLGSQDRTLSRPAENRRARRRWPTDGTCLTPSYTAALRPPRPGWGLRVCPLSAPTPPAPANLGRMACRSRRGPPRNVSTAAAAEARARPDWRS
jgi:hypothetical protein